MSIQCIEHIKNFDNEEIKIRDDYKMNLPKELPQGFLVYYLLVIVEVVKLMQH